MKINSGPFAVAQYGAVADGFLTLVARSWIPVVPRWLCYRSALAINFKMIQDSGTMIEWLQPIPVPPNFKRDPDFVPLEDFGHIIELHGEEVECAELSDELLA